MRRLDRETAAQMQLLESVMVALFIFVAIAVVAIYRLPTNPQTFTLSKLEDYATDALNVRSDAQPQSGDDCNESPCPFEKQLHRMVSLAMGYVGPTQSGEVPDDSELRDFLNETLKTSNYQLAYSNAFATMNLTGKTPPASNVVVAHTWITANWTVWGANLNESAVVRIGELPVLSGVPATAPTEIRDALGRTENEAGFVWKDALGGDKTRVPGNATYGTHRVCYPAAVMAGGCRYITVVPPGIVAPGNQILANDAVPLAPLTSVANWSTAIRMDSVAVLPATDFYIKMPGNTLATVQVGDLRITPVHPCRTVDVVDHPCAAGSIVRVADLDEATILFGPPASVTAGVRVADRDDDGAIDEGESVYVHLGAGIKPLEGDLRLSRAGVFSMGSVMADADPDDDKWESLNLLAPKEAWIRYLNVNGDANWDEGEPVFFDLNMTAVGSANLGPNDYYLHPVGAPMHRYAYDVKLRVWYGF